MTAVCSAADTPNAIRADGPRVLFVLPRPCWPPDTGAKLRNYHLIRGLSASADVRVVMFTDPRTDPDESAGLLGPTTGGITTVRRPHGRSRVNLLRGLIGGRPFPVLSYTSKTMMDAIVSQPDGWCADIVQIEGTQLAANAMALSRRLRRPAVVCDWHNVESELLHRYAAVCGSRGHRAYARATAARMERHEANVASTFDAHIAVTERDAERIVGMHSSAAVEVIDNGVDIDHYSDASLRSAHGALRGQSADGPRRNRLVFVGSMDYHANVDGATWFATSIWPAIRSAVPGCVFTIVGRDPAPAVRSLAGQPGIEVTGTVPDVRPYYWEALAAVVPLRVGGGSRLKILEAMAGGVPVVSTPLGAEGLGACDGEHLLLADTANGFAAALQALQDRNGPRVTLSCAGRTLVQERYGWGGLVNKLAAFHLRVLAGQHR